MVTLLAYMMDYYGVCGIGKISHRFLKSLYRILQVESSKLFDDSQCLWVIFSMIYGKVTGFERVKLPMEFMVHFFFDG
jgi:hypothetical protein